MLGRGMGVGEAEVAADGVVETPAPGVGVPVGAVGESVEVSRELQAASRSGTSSAVNTGTFMFNESACLT